MKTFKLTILFLFLPLFFFAQSLTGLWVGTVSNDSTTIRKDQAFEIVLTQYKDKVYGYSRSTFIVNDSLFYIVKRVLGSIDGDICEVKDDDIVSYNFKGRLDKKVKVITTFHLDHEENAWKMDGDWKTNQTKKYYSLSGKMKLKEEKDLQKSKIFPHLEELNLADDVPFYKESKKAAEAVATTQPVIKSVQQEPVVKTEKPTAPLVKETKKDAVAIVTTKPETIPVTNPKTIDPKTTTILKEDKPAVAATNDAKKDDVAKVTSKSGSVPETTQKNNDIKTSQPVKEETLPVTSQKSATVAVVNQKPKDPPVTVAPVKETKTDIASVTPKQENKKSEPVVITKPVEQKKDVVTAPVTTEVKKTETVSTTPIVQKEQAKTVSVVPETKAVTSTAAAQIAERKTVAPQIINFKSDSLELSLYDNGEVDGDTVSVLLNGEIILAKQGLKASAIKKMIYAPGNNNDSLTMILYAENLGKYPPNTGLLIIHDGEDTYQVRFSADLQQNAAIIFKRKRIIP